MQRKHFLFASAALALIMSSCSDEIVTDAVNGDGFVTFTAQLPEGVNSRAYSDGTGEKVLKYAVYETGKKTVVYSSTQSTAPAAVYTEANKTFSLSLPLVKGQTYDLIFWAEAAIAEGATSPYTFNPDNQTITIDYNGIKCNDESRDAFFTSVTGFEVNGASQESVKLYRPFAQLNIGTNDIATAEGLGISVGETKVEVTDVYQTLNLLDGIASDETAVEFGLNSVPDKSNYVYPVSGYDYLSMNYILTGSIPSEGDINNAQKETKDVTITINDNTGKQITEVKASAVPFQRNYRTNIYGALLTSTVDYTIEIVPDYNDGDNDIKLEWDGKIGKLPAPDADGVYTIKNPGELAALAEAVNAGDNFAGKTIKLDANINLNNQPWTPIGYYESGKTQAPFSGTFDGGNHTITGLNVVVDNYKQAAGFFGLATTAVIKDVTFIGSKVQGTAYTGVVAGLAYRGNSYITLSNITVDGAEVISIPAEKDGVFDGGNNVGGLVGLTQYGVDMQNCTVKNTSVTGYAKVGALTGLACNQQPFNESNHCVYENNQAENCTVNQSLVNAYEDAVPSTIGKLYGMLSGSELSETNTATNVTVNAIPDIQAAITTGGNVEVNNYYPLIDLSSVPNGVNLTLNAAVGTVKLGHDFNNPVTITVAKDVEFPKFTFDVQQGYVYNIKDFTLKGDLSTSKPCPGFKIEDFRHLMTNVVFENVLFSDRIYHYGVANGVTVRNCTFDNVVNAAVWISNDNKPEDRGYGTGVTVEGCTIITSPDANPKDTNGIYINGQESIIVKDNIVKDTPYHGITIRPTESCVVTGNTVSNIGHDGIKIEAHLGVKTIELKNNNIQSKENGIRVKGADTATAITATGNTIDMSKTIAFENGEPYGILLLGKATPVLTVKDNIKKGENEHWFNTDMTGATGSDYENPFN